MGGDEMGLSRLNRRWSFVALAGAILVIAFAPYLADRASAYFQLSGCDEGTAKEIVHAGIALVIFLLGHLTAKLKSDSVGMHYLVGLGILAVIVIVAGVFVLGFSSALAKEAASGVKGVLSLAAGPHQGRLLGERIA
jgi:hypothetical protein